MLRFELSAEADNDLENIFSYRADNFGLEPALVFYNSLNDFFDIMQLFIDKNSNIS